MKALSLWEPWATLVVIGAKRIETRSWSTDYRGALLIHAAGKVSKPQIEICHEEPFRTFLRANGIQRWQDFKLGCVIGSVDLINCLQIVEPSYAVPDVSVAPPPEPELSFGIYKPGRYAYGLANHQRFAEPIKHRGLQRFFNIHPQVLGFS